MSAQSLLDKVRLDTHGLVPAIAQDAASGQVLMLAHMKEDVPHHTLKTGWMMSLVQVRCAPTAVLVG